MIDDGGQTYAYDFDNRLVSASGGAGLADDPTSRLYEVAGGSTTRLLYDGPDVIAELEPDGQGGHAVLRRLAMWTKETRARAAAIEKRTKRHPTDLTDEERAVVAPLLPQPAKRGRKRETDLREALNAIRYLARTGCGWRMPPKDFPPWRTVYWRFRRLMRRFLSSTVHDVALMIDRERSGREASVGRGRGPIALPAHRIRRRHLRRP